MAERDSFGSAGVLLVFFAGAVAGAAAALLLAPATGEETREYLGQQARVGREKVRDAARQGRELLNQQREQFSSAYERARRESGRAGREHDA